MWAMAYRYHRPAFWLLLPMVLSLYVSTFCGRDHYASDAVLGIATGVVAKMAPALTRAWERRTP